MAEASDAERAGAIGARSWIGHRLDDISGEGVGRVEGLFVAESSGEPLWILARMGRFGHHTLVPLRDAVEGVGRMWVPYTVEMIRGAPRVDPNEPLEAAAERALLDHYGIAANAARRAQLGRLADDAVSARPG